MCLLISGIYRVKQNPYFFIYKTQWVLQGKWSGKEGELSWDVAGEREALGNSKSSPPKPSGLGPARRKAAWMAEVWRKKTNLAYFLVSQPVLRLLLFLLRCKNVSVIIGDDSLIRKSFFKKIHFGTCISPKYFSWSVLNNALWDTGRGIQVSLDHISSPRIWTSYNLPWIRTQSLKLQRLFHCLSPSWLVSVHVCVYLLGKLWTSCFSS